MNIILSVLGTLALGFFLNIIMKQTYNFVFFLGKKPVLWIILITIISVLFWFLSAFFGWSVSVPFWACVIALLANLPRGSTKESKELANEFYSEMGIKHGTLLHRLGLGGFVVAAIVSWVIFYGQTCDSSFQCSNFF